MHAEKAGGKAFSKMWQHDEPHWAFSAGHVMMRNNTVHDAYYQYGPEGLINGPSITAYAKAIDEHVNPQGNI